jgi:hypothetical protein
MFTSITNWQPAERIPAQPTGVTGASQMPVIASISPTAASSRVARVVGAPTRWPWQGSEEPGPCLRARSKA